MIEEKIYEIVLNNGMLGAVVAWFMLRMEKLIKANTEALILVKDLLKGRK